MRSNKAAYARARRNRRDLERLYFGFAFPSLEFSSTIFFFHRCNVQEKVIFPFAMAVVCVFLAPESGLAVLRMARRYQDGYTSLLVISSVNGFCGPE